MPYTEEYESSLLRGMEDPRPWDIAQEVLKFVNSETCVLDVGCGTCSKLKPIASKARVVFGLDPNPRMLKKAKENANVWGIRNLFLIQARGEHVPFPDDSFDVATSMVAIHDPSEMARILTEDGVAIVEQIGDRDKWNLKAPFGNDEDGPRGFYLDFSPGSRVEVFKREFQRCFSDVQIVGGKWRTFYSMEGFVRLCEQVSMVRNFDRVRDSDVLRTIEHNMMTPSGIETVQERFLIIAKSPRRDVDSSRESLGSRLERYEALWGRSAPKPQFCD